MTKDEKLKDEKKTSEAPSGPGWDLVKSLCAEAQCKESLSQRRNGEGKQKKQQFPNNSQAYKQELKS